MDDDTKKYIDEKLEELLASVRITVEDQLYMVSTAALVGALIGSCATMGDSG